MQLVSKWLNTTLVGFKDVFKLFPLIFHHPILDESLKLMPNRLYSPSMRDEPETPNGNQAVPFNFNAGNGMNSWQRLPGNIQSNISAQYPRNPVLEHQIRFRSPAVNPRFHMRPNGSTSILGPILARTPAVAVGYPRSSFDVS